MRFLAVAAVLPLLAACGSLPSAGPSSSEVVKISDSSRSPYDVISLDASIADILAAHEFQSLASTFGRGGPPELHIGIGDTVVVTIFEAASGGLFSGEAGSIGAASKSVSLPPQPVARNGMISVPYAGQIRAAGLTPVQVQAAVEAALRDKAIEPQVIVTVTQSSSTFVTMVGDVGAPHQVPLNLGGDRILDLIADSGGTKGPGFDSFVRLTRGSKSVTVNVSRLVEDPSQNVYLHPNDQVYVFTDPQIYTLFGAAARNSTFPFDTDRLTLAEAVGKAGGLLDSRADAQGVFLFRYERPELWAAIRSPRLAPETQNGGIPVVYRLDLKNPKSFFAAQRFLMRDNDVIFISNAPSTDLQKFLSIIGSGLGFVSTTAGVANEVQSVGQ
jgi:polysaccharide export outer membrane protein